MLNESITSLLSHVAHLDFRKEYLMGFLKIRERNNQINTLSLFAKLAKLLCIWVMRSQFLVFNLLLDVVSAPRFP
jgi:hypothetical protein